VKKRHLLSGICLLAFSLASSTVFATAPSLYSPLPGIEPSSWTLAILPDTQYYTQYAPSTFYGQTQFLANNKTNLNIQYVLHEGDVTRSNGTAQWQVAVTAMNTLQTAGIGYSILPGNHDYAGNSASRDSHMLEYFPVSKLATQPTFGGFYSNPSYVNAACNTYSLFSAGGTDWLVLSLEFGPRDGVVNWADNMMKAYPKRKVIIDTHSNLDSYGTIVDHNNPAQEGSPYGYDLASLPGGVNDGLEMWNQLKDNPNLLFVFNGHAVTPGYAMLEDPNGAGGFLTSTADDGHTVYQMIANYQAMPDYGQGWLRLLEFQTDGEVHVRTYSSLLNKGRNDADNDFVFKVPEPSTITLLLTIGLVVIVSFRRRKGA
jgi:hypothetical protein